MKLLHHGVLIGTSAPVQSRRLGSTGVPLVGPIREILEDGSGEQRRNQRTLTCWAYGRAESHPPWLRYVTGGSPFPRDWGRDPLPRSTSPSVTGLRLNHLTDFPSPRDTHFTSGKTLHNRLRVQA